MERLELILPFLEVLDDVKSLPNPSWCGESTPLPSTVVDLLMCILLCVSETAGNNTPVEPEQRKIEKDLRIQFLSCLLAQSCPRLAAEVLEIWQEFTNGDSRTAELVCQIGKLDSLYQTLVHAKRKGLYDIKQLKVHCSQIADEWLANQADAILAELETIKHKRLSIPIIFVIGGPGAGKGTLCARLVQKFNYYHISVGELLREEQDRPGSVFGDFISKSLTNSVVVPASLTMMLLKQKVQHAVDQGQGILIDGFPRSLSQIIAFEQEISSDYSTLFLDCETEKLMDRVRQRSITLARSDDETSVLRKRIATFLQTKDAILYHLERHKLSTIDGNGSADEVFAAAEKIITTT